MKGSGLGRYFEPGSECEILGMRLRFDPQRVEEMFPNHKPWWPSRIIVLDPGPLAESMGLAPIREGDLLWILGDDVARFEEVFIDCPAAFVGALVEMYHPRASTKCCFVCGTDRSGDGPKKGLTWCCSIQVPESEIGSLRSLRDELARHAREHGLKWRSFRRHYHGGPYWWHVLKRTLRVKLRQWRRRDKDVIFVEAPVHYQYGWQLLMSLGQLAPCSVVLKGEKSRLRMLPAGEGAQSRETAARLREVMDAYQLGSSWWLLRSLRSWAGPRGLIRFAWGDRTLSFRLAMIGPWTARISASVEAGED